MKGKDLVPVGSSQIEQRLASDGDFRDWYLASDRHHLNSLAPHVSESGMTLIEFIQSELGKDPEQRKTRVPQDVLENIEEAETKRLERLRTTALARRAKRKLKPRILKGLPLTTSYCVRRRVLRGGYLNVEKFLNEVQCELKEKHRPRRVRLISTFRIGGGNFQCAAVFEIQADHEEVIYPDRADEADLVPQEYPVELSVDRQLERVYRNRAHRGAFHKGYKAYNENSETAVCPYPDDHTSRKGYRKAWFHGRNTARQDAKRLPKVKER